MIPSRSGAIAQRERERASGADAISATRGERSLVWTALIVVAGVGAVFWLISPTPVEPDERDDGPLPPPGSPDPREREDGEDRAADPTRGANEPP